MQLTVDTTDVQSVVVMETERSIRCVFISGSDAQGCMVVLVGQFENLTMKLMKRSADLIHTEKLELTHRTLPCYHSVIAFDIESDGSIGTLPVPGDFERSRDQNGPCISTEGSQAPSTTFSLSGMIALNDYFLTIIT